MESLEGGAAAAREGPDARPRRAFDECRGTSRTRGRAADALCGMRRSRQCHGRQRLRLLAKSACRPCPPQHHVGEASRPCRRRCAGVEDGMAIDGAGKMLRAALTFLGALLLASTHAAAQNFPNRPITLMVGLPGAECGRSPVPRKYTGEEIRLDDHRREPYRCGRWCGCNSCSKCSSRRTYASGLLGVSACNRRGGHPWHVSIGRGLFADQPSLRRHDDHRRSSQKPANSSSNFLIWDEPSRGAC